MTRFCTQFAPLSYRYFQIPLSISISIFLKDFLLISIFFRIALSISIFPRIALSILIFSYMTISISISIFFKSVDISTVNIPYRYIEQGQHCHFSLNFAFVCLLCEFHALQHLGICFELHLSCCSDLERLLWPCALDCMRIFFLNQQA